MDSPTTEPITPAWLLARAVLLLGALVAANPIVLLVLTRSPLITTAIVLSAVLGLQALYRPVSRSPLLPYAVNFLVLGSVIVNAEYVLRTFLSHRVVPNIYQLEDGYYFNRPRLRLTFDDPEYRALYATNAQGLRIGETDDPERLIATADWVFLGDSFTQGAQVSFEALYSSVLYRFFPDRIIVNLGASGLGIGEELELYRNRGSPLKPSIVFLQLSPFNDFMNVEPRQVTISERLVTHSALFRTVIHSQRYQDPKDLPLGRWTEPFYPDRAANQRFNVFYRDTNISKERDLDLFKRYLHGLKESVQKAGARLVVVLIPSREQAIPSALSEVQAAFQIASSELDMLRPNRLLGELGREHGIEVIDLLDSFRKEGASAFFEWDEHLTPRGHALVADGIRRAVEGWSLPEPRVRTVRFEAERYPRISCGGTLLSYQAPVRGAMEIFTLDLSSQGTRQLTFDGEPKAHPMLSSDCDKLLYTRGEADRLRTDVVMVQLATGFTTVLTSGPQEFGAIPFLDRANRYVAFAEWRELEKPSQLTNPVIAVQDLESGHRKYVTEDRYESWRPAFSPDGGRLVFIAKPTGQFDLYVHDLVSGETRQLTATPYDEWDPSFSESGQTVVYAARKDGNWDLFTVDIQSGLEQRLTHSKGDEWDPVFAPDDRSVYFAGEFGAFAGIYELAVSR